MVSEPKLKRQEGSAVVETSFAALVLILLLIAIFEFGMVFSTYAATLNASRAGATYASMHPDPSDPAYMRYADIVRNEMRAAHLNMNNVEVLTPETPEGLGAGHPLGVTVMYRLQTFSSGISLPVFGRFGLPRHYIVTGKTVVPIR